jgi:hypothetical protein
MMHSICSPAHPDHTPATHTHTHTWARTGALPGARLQRARGPPRPGDQRAALAVRPRGAHHALQLPAGDPRAAAHGCALHGQQAARARRPQGALAGAGGGVGGLGGWVSAAGGQSATAARRCSRDASGDALCALHASLPGATPAAAAAGQRRCGAAAAAAAPLRHAAHGRRPHPWRRRGGQRAAAARAAPQHAVHGVAARRGEAGRGHAGQGARVPGEVLVAAAVVVVVVVVVVAGLCVPPAACVRWHTSCSCCLARLMRARPAARCTLHAARCTPHAAPGVPGGRGL